MTFLKFKNCCTTKLIRTMTSEWKQSSLKQNNLVAVVTGGNRGIGFEVCKELSNIGCSVILTSRNVEQGKQAVAKLDNDNKNVVYHKLDVTNSKDIESLRNWILNKYGRVDILINNAGIYIDEGISVFKVDESIVKETLETNFLEHLKYAEPSFLLWERMGMAGSWTFHQVMELWARWLDIMLHIEYQRPHSML